MANFNLTKEFPEIKDKYRRISLYSDFSNQRELNPVNFEANVGFWKRAIIRLLDCESASNSKSLSHLCFRSDYLTEALAYQDAGGSLKPLAIEIVMNEMVKAGELIPTEAYLDRYGISANNNWRSWLWRQVSGIFTSSPKAYREFAVKSKLSSAVSSILKYFNNTCEYPMTDSLFDLPGLITRIFRPSIRSVDWDNVSEEVIGILLAGLHENGCSLRNEGGIVYIKLVTSNFKSTKFTDVDLNILSVKKAHESLKTQIASLEKQAEDIHVKIKESSRLGNKAHALRQLKQKKQVEAILDKRLIAFENLGSILRQVQQSEMDRLMVDAYQEGSKGLRDLLAGVGVDQVQTALDQIQDALADFTQVQDIIATPLAPEDADLEDELKSLIDGDSPNLDDSLIEELDKLKISDTHLPSSSINSPSRTAELA